MSEILNLRSTQDSEEFLSVSVSDEHFMDFSVGYDTEVTVTIPVSTEQVAELSAKLIDFLEEESQLSPNRNPMIEVSEGITRDTVTNEYFVWSAFHQDLVATTLNIHIATAAQAADEQSFWTGV